jgi:hypothetical protein
MQRTGWRLALGNSKADPDPAPFNKSLSFPFELAVPPLNGSEHSVAILASGIRKTGQSNEFPVQPERAHRSIAVVAR